MSADGLSITQAGYTDWRIPNIVELRGILLAEFPCPSNPCIDGTFGPTAFVYWSSSSNASDPGLAWVVDFTNGGVGTFGENQAFLARAVRGGR